MFSSRHHWPKPQPQVTLCTNTASSPEMTKLRRSSHLAAVEGLLLWRKQVQQSSQAQRLIWSYWRRLWIQSSWRRLATGGSDEALIPKKSNLYILNTNIPKIIETAAPPTDFLLGFSKFLSHKWKVSQYAHTTLLLYYSYNWKLNFPILALYKIHKTNFIVFRYIFKHESSL